MKKILILSMFIAFALICSCEKQDSAAEQQLAQRKAELDAREKALDERLSALDEKVNALDEKLTALLEKEKAMASARTIPAGSQTQISDPAQVQTERDAAIQQFSTEIRARISDDLKMKAETDRAKRRALEELQSQREPRQPKLKMSGGAVLPAPEATSPTPSPTVEASLPTPSPTP